jgi:hypothetical protein
MMPSHRSIMSSAFSFPAAALLAAGVLWTAASAAPSDSVFTSSNLPIVVIDTRGQPIVDEPKIPARMGIIDNGEGVRNFLSDPFNAYDGQIGIEIRGSSSQMFPKKQYGVETRDSLGEDMDAELLGLPAESDWILSAPYSDKSLIRDALTYVLARRMGRYASRARFCEVVINGDYKGVYVLFEKIKRDKNRVAVAKLTEADTTGDKLTGGYIIKNDKLDGSSTTGWYSGFPPYPGAWQRVYYQYHDPDGGDLTPSQMSYIQLFIRDFEVAMELPTYADSSAGYPRYIDVMSFVDGILVCELAKNVDAYRLSSFYHKDRDSKGGRLVMGPLWDFNHGFGNCDYYDGAVPSGFQLIYLATDPTFHANDSWQQAFWWKKLFQESGFFCLLQERWAELRGGCFSEDSLLATVDSLSGLLAEAAARNFDRWPILGTYVWPNAYIGQTYDDELLYLKSWIRSRLLSLDMAFFPCDAGGAAPRVPCGVALEQNYPNPFNAGTVITYHLPSAGRITLALYDALGREVRVLEDGVAAGGAHASRVEVPGLASGMYLYRLSFRPGGTEGAAGAGGVPGPAVLTGRMMLIR